MPLITRRRRCAICEKWMEVGERFEFYRYEWHGRVDHLPVHRMCAMPAEIRKTLEKVIERGIKEAAFDPSDTWVI